MLVSCGVSHKPQAMAPFNSREGSFWSDSIYFQQLMQVLGLRQLSTTLFLTYYVGQCRDGYTNFKSFYLVFPTTTAPILYVQYQYVCPTSKDVFINYTFRKPEKWSQDRWIHCKMNLQQDSIYYLIPLCPCSDRDHDSHFKAQVSASTWTLYPAFFKRSVDSSFSA